MGKKQMGIFRTVKPVNRNPRVVVHTHTQQKAEHGVDIKFNTYISTFSIIIAIFMLHLAWGWCTGLENSLHVAGGGSGTRR